MSACLDPRQNNSPHQDWSSRTKRPCSHGLLSKPVTGRNCASCSALPTKGQRSMLVGGRLKAAGLKAGVPDVFLPVARCGKHGLWIEMKVIGNRTTPQQDKWLCDLASEGYSVCVAYSWIEARELILEYLKGRF